MLPGLGAYITEEEDEAECREGPELAEESGSHGCSPTRSPEASVCKAAPSTPPGATNATNTTAIESKAGASPVGVPAMTKGETAAVEEPQKKKRKRKRTTNGLPPPSFIKSALPAPFAASVPPTSTMVPPPAKKQRQSPLTSPAVATAALLPPQLRGSRPNTVTEDMTKYYSASWTSQVEKR